MPRRKRGKVEKERGKSNEKVSTVSVSIVE